MIPHTLRRPLQRDGREPGFTLIELLVVILIIGILAAIAIPMFLNQRKAASDASLRSDVKNMALAMETWQTQTGKLAGDIPAEDRIAGWSVILHGSDDARFTGFQSEHVNHVFEGFDAPSISEGNAIGVVTNPSIQTNQEKGYCIAGNNEGGSYEAFEIGEERPEGVSGFSRPLYYDSLGGGMYEPEDLPENGACQHYRTRIVNGT